MLVQHGLKVTALPTREIAKIDAGLSCMSLRWFDRSARAAPLTPRPVSCR